jgi:uncharacterized membrane protein
VLGALVLVSLLGLGLVAFGTAHTGRGDSLYLLWNLFLAWLPVVLALVVYDGYRRAGLRWELAAPALGWLLFLPNAPYLVTDFVHLEGHPALGKLFWFDLATLSTFALAGLLLGFVSLALIHVVAQRVAGSLVAWGFAASALALCSVGVYLGRFLRLNSWDAVTRPLHLVGLARTWLADPLQSTRLLVVTTLLTLFLALGYLVVYAVLRPAVELDRRPRR